MGVCPIVSRIFLKKKISDKVPVCVSLSVCEFHTENETKNNKKNDLQEERDSNLKMYYRVFGWHSV